MVVPPLLLSLCSTREHHYQGVNDTDQPYALLRRNELSYPTQVVNA